MIKVTFIEHDGTERSVEAVDGNSLMLAAVSNSVPGIDADCGGCCSCGTCHVYVNEEWLDKLKPMDDDEEDMLDMVDDRRSNSRLACQITVRENLDGLVVTTPEFQF